jgi:hypothetical protein
MLNILFINFFCMFCVAFEVMNTVSVFFVLDWIFTSTLLVRYCYNLKYKLPRTRTYSIPSRSNSFIESKTTFLTSTIRTSMSLQRQWVFFYLNKKVLFVLTFYAWVDQGLGEVGRFGPDRSNGACVIGADIQRPLWLCSIGCSLGYALNLFCQLLHYYVYWI